MSKIALDLKQFKHLHSTPETTTLQHKAGHILTIANKALSPEAQKQLGSLSKMGKDAMTMGQASESKTKLMADGGLAQQQDMEKTANPESAEDAEERTASSRSNVIAGGAAPSKAQMDEYNSPKNTAIRAQYGFADGGEVNPKLEQSKKQSPKQDKPSSGTLDYTNFPADTQEKNNRFKREDMAKREPLRKMYANPDGAVSQDDSAPAADPNSAPGPGIAAPVSGVTDYSPTAMSPEDLQKSKADYNQAEFNQHKEDLKQQFPGESDDLYDKLALNKVKQSNNDTQASMQASDDQDKAKAQFEQQKAKILGQPTSGVGQGAAPSPSALPASGAAQGDQQSDNPYGDVSYLNQSQHALQEQEAGQIGEQQAMGKLGQQQAQAEQQQIQSMQKLQADYQNNIKSLAQEGQSIAHDLQNGHIDPTRYIKNMSTGGAIGTALGLIVSGLGSGLSGQPNMAYDFLNKQIDRDIDSQKQDMANKHNLLSYNTAQQGNTRLGAEVTRMQNIEILNAKLKSMADQTQNPLAKAHIMSISGQFDQQQAELAHKTAILMTARGAAAGDNPAGALRMQQMAGVITPEQQKQGNEEIAKVQNSMQLNKNALDSFDNVAKMNTLKNRLANPVQAQERIDAEWNPMMDKLTKDTEGRVTPITVDMMSSLKPKLKDDEYSMNLKRQKFNAILHSGLSTPTLDGLGIKIQKGMPDKRATSNQIPQALQFNFKPGGN